ncbi:MAG: hypothetical protein KAJ32_02105 [Gammaproteobacteria bacterium]|nr:hypothetical protein [Gammaproteobacteria bacterium]
MNNYKYFADIYVHLHPDSLSVDRSKVEQELRDSSGVFTVRFDADKYRDAMFVSYNPNAVSSEVLLEIIRKSYVRAVSVASMLMRVRNK